MTDGPTARQRMEDLAPEYFAELMREFMKNPDLVERQRIRRRIRAILDLFSADTKWPAGRPVDRPVDRPRIPGGFGDLGQGPVMPPGVGVDHGPRAPAADELAEPPPIPDAIPVPGAGVAERL